MDNVHKLICIFLCGSLFEFATTRLIRNSDVGPFPELSTSDRKRNEHGQKVPYLILYRANTPRLPNHLGNWSFDA